jgi:hypothetical protein
MHRSEDTLLSSTLQDAHVSLDGLQLLTNTHKSVALRHMLLL